MRIGIIGLLNLWILACVCVNGAINPAHAQGEKDSNYQLRKVQGWRMASVQHHPGEADAAAANISSREEEDLEIVIEFITKLASQSAKKARRTLARASLRRILQLTHQEVKSGDLNRVLKLG